MKKVAIIFLALILSTSPLYAMNESRSDAAPLARSGIVFLRGIANIIASPAEFVSTARREPEMHEKLWPATTFPRMMNNFFTRVASGVHDAFFMPWVAPFTTDISPLTEPMGLPDYPWEVEA